MTSNKRKDIVGFLIALLVIILINFIGTKLFHRFDLTTEKRYSLSQQTIDLISQLQDDVFVSVYLKGDFPASFKRLQNETKEMLDEFQAYSGGKIKFDFINPSENPDIKERDRVYKNLYKKGLRPTDLNIKDDDGVSKKVVWPGAIMAYQEQEVAIQLLKSQVGAPPEIVLNQSIESLEYELAFALKKLTTPFIQRIAFIEGHGELNKFETADMVGSLREFYDVERVSLNGNINSLAERRYIGKDSAVARISNFFDAIVIAKPDSIFNEKDKFIIDQYLMNGGKIVWLIDQVEVSMDSLQRSSSGNSRNTTLAMPKQLNLDDQLFQYGVRINNDLIQDLRAAPIPVVSGQYGTQVRTEFFPWLYFPLLFSKNDHPINKNMDVVKAEFASSIDLVGGSELKKSVILSTSKKTKTVKAPTRVSLNMLGFEPNEDQFNKESVPIGVLVEGEFESIYKNRLTPNILNSKQIQFKARSPKTQQLFFSDGDLIRNEYNENSNEFMALGYDRYTRQMYGNKDFMLQAINFLVDESGLILSKSKSFKIRLLDNEYIDRKRLLIQTLNTAIPIALVMLFGTLLFIIRKRKFAVK